MDWTRIDTWIFDVDNTLYPHNADMWAQTQAHIRGYLARHHGVGDEEVRAIQRRYIAEYGTSMRGLIEEEGVDPHDFIAFEDGQMDYTVLAADPDLRAAIEGLPGRKVLHSNASEPHVRSVLAARGLEDLFDHTFDIIASDFLPKPHEATHRAALAAFDADPERSCMVDDMPANLRVPRRLGLATVLVDATADAVPWRECDDADAVTSDLPAFLRWVVASR